MLKTVNCMARRSLLISAMLLAGCATSVLTSQRTPALTQPVQTAALVVIANAMEAHSAAPSLGTALGFGGGYAMGTTSSALTKDAQAVGEELVRQLPPSLKAAGLALQGQAVFTTTYPSGPQELMALLPAGTTDPVLVIKPIGAKMECPGSCFAFMVSARLLAADRSTLLWSATLQMPPKASKFTDFAAPVQTFVETLVLQLKKDAVLR